MLLNVLTYWPPKQNGQYFADDIFKCIFLNEYFKFWLKYVCKVLIDKTTNIGYGLIPSGSKPLPEPMLT